VPVDAPLAEQDLSGFKEAAMSMEAIEGYAKQIDAKHALFLFDSCFSGSFFKMRAAPEIIARKTLLPVRQFITAGDADQPVPDVSLFRREFITALTGAADFNRDGYLTGSELGSYLEDKVTQYSHGTQTPQYGKIVDRSLDKGDFVFALPAPNQDSQSAHGTTAPQGNGVALDDLKQEAQRHKGWQDWQNRMRADYAQVENLSGGGEIKQQAWTRFLAAYPENNPYSNEAENLRASARTALESAKRRQPGQTFKDCADCPEMVVIPAGNFQMGSPESEKDRSSDEGPVHLVNVASFVLGKTEVTQAQWRAVMGSDPPELFFIGCDNCPVETVSWDDIQAFIVKLNAKTGQSYRLPSEAEWEYACRAGGQQRYCGGDELDRLAWYDKNSGSKTHAVATKQANAWGLHDMSGNVWEWTQDCWNERYTGAPSDGSAWTKGNCSYRVLRGGSWYNFPNYARAAIRFWFTPGKRIYYLGFRLARTF